MNFVEALSQSTEFQKAYEEAAADRWWLLWRSAWLSITYQHEVDMRRLIQSERLYMDELEAR